DDELRSDAQVRQGDGQVVEEAVRRPLQLPADLRDQSPLPGLQRNLDEQGPVRALRSQVLRQRRDDGTAGHGLDDLRLADDESRVLERATVAQDDLADGDPNAYQAVDVRQQEVSRLRLEPLIHGASITI